MAREPDDKQRAKEMKNSRQDVCGRHLAPVEVAVGIGAFNQDSAIE